MNCICLTSLGHCFSTWFKYYRGDKEGSGMDGRGALHTSTGVMTRAPIAQNGMLVMT
jgi:hypothetical protein